VTWPRTHLRETPTLLTPSLPPTPGTLTWGSTACSALHRVSMAISDQRSCFKLKKLPFSSILIKCQKLQYPIISFRFGNFRGNADNGDSDAEGLFLPSLANAPQDPPSSSHFLRHDAFGEDC
jgi:hypothetical protein